METRILNYELVRRSGTVDHPEPVEFNAELPSL